MQNKILQDIRHAITKAFEPKTTASKSHNQPNSQKVNQKQEQEKIEPKKSGSSMPKVKLIKYPKITTYDEAPFGRGGYPVCAKDLAFSSSFKFDYAQDEYDNCHLSDEVRQLFYLVQNCVSSGDKLVGVLEITSIETEFAVKMYISDRDTLVTRLNAITEDALFEMRIPEKPQEDEDNAHQVMKRERELQFGKILSDGEPEEYHIESANSYQVQKRLTRHESTNTVNKTGACAASQYHKRQTVTTLEEYNPTDPKENPNKDKWVEVNSCLFAELNTMKLKINQISSELQKSQNLNSKYLKEIDHLNQISEMEKSRHELLEQAIAAKDVMVSTLKRFLTDLTQQPRMDEYFWLLEEESRKRNVAESPIRQKFLRERKKMESELILQGQMKNDLYCNNRLSTQILEEMHKKHNQQILNLRNKCEYMTEDYENIRKLYNDMQRQYNTVLGKFNLKELEQKWVYSSLQNLCTRLGNIDTEDRKTPVKLMSTPTNASKNANTYCNSNSAHTGEDPVGPFAQSGSDIIFHEKLSGLMKDVSEQQSIEVVTEESDDIHGCIMKLEQLTEQLKDKRPVEDNKGVYPAEKIKKLQGTVQKLRKQKEQAISRVLALDNQKTQLQIQVEQLKNKLKSANPVRENITLKKSPASCDKQVEQLKKDLRQLQEKHTKLESQYSRLNNEWVVSQNMTKVNESQSVSVQRQLKVLKKNYNELEAQHSALAQIRISLDTEMLKLQGKLSQLEIDYRQLLEENRQLKHQQNQKGSFRSLSEVNRQTELRYLELAELDAKIVQKTSELDELKVNYVQLDSGGCTPNKLPRLFYLSNGSPTANQSPRKINRQQIVFSTLEELNRASISNIPAIDNNKYNIIQQQNQELADSNALLADRIKILQRQLEAEKKRSEELVNELLFKENNINNSEFGLVVKNEELQQVIEVQTMLINKFKQQLGQNGDQAEKEYSEVQSQLKIKQEVQSMGALPDVNEKKLSIVCDPSAEFRRTIEELEEKIQYLIVEVTVERCGKEEIEVELAKHADTIKEYIEKTQSLEERCIVQQSKIQQREQDVQELKEASQQQELLLRDLTQNNKEAANQIQRLENNIVEYVYEIQRLRQIVFNYTRNNRKEGDSPVQQDYNPINQNAFILPNDDNVHQIQFDSEKLDETQSPRHIGSYRPFAINNPLSCKAIQGQKQVASLDNILLETQDRNPPKGLQPHSRFSRNSQKRSDNPSGFVEGGQILSAIQVSSNHNVIEICERLDRKRSEKVISFARQKSHSNECRSRSKSHGKQDQYLVYPRDAAHSEEVQGEDKSQGRFMSIHSNLQRQSIIKKGLPNASRELEVVQPHSIDSIPFICPSNLDAIVEGMESSVASESKQVPSFVKELHVQHLGGAVGFDDLPDTSENGSCNYVIQINNHDVFN